MRKENVRFSGLHAFNSPLASTLAQTNLTCACYAQSISIELRKRLNDHDFKLKFCINITQITAVGRWTSGDEKGKGDTDLDKRP